MKNFILKACALILAVFMCLPCLGVAVFADESVDVKIPVSCSGADCTAVLYDEDGQELQRKEVKIGETDEFEFKCDGLKNFKYKVKLDNADTDKCTYDKNEFYITVYVCYNDTGDKVISTVTVESKNASGSGGMIKPARISFINRIKAGGYNRREITVNKVWDVKGEHPDSVKINLLRNGRVIETVELNKLNNWKYAWTKPDDGNIYTVSEMDIPDEYTVSVTGGNGKFTVTNTKPDETPAKTTEVSVRKIWSNIKPGEKTPDFVKVNLLSNGVVIETVELNESNNWNYKWDGLAEDGKYSVSEIDVPVNFKASISLNGTTYTINNKKIDIPPLDDPTLGGGGYHGKPKDPDKPNYPNLPNPHESVDPVKPVEPINPTNPTNSNITGSTDLHINNTAESIDNPKIPTTGDDTHFELWRNMIIVSACGLVLLGKTLVKNRQKKDE